MRRLLWLVAGVMVGYTLGTLLLVSHAEVEPTDDTLAVAASAGVDAMDLQGAVNSTGLKARAYLVAVGELAAPSAPAPAPRPVARPPAPRPVASSGGPFGLSPYLARVAACESHLNPGAVGKAGEIGLFQLHPRGLLPLFYRLGFGNPWNGWSQAAFARWAFAHGLGHLWSCA